MKRNIKLIMNIIMLSVLLSSCMSTTPINVGTGRPMQKTCGGGWYGGQ